MKVALFTPNNRIGWTEALSYWTATNATVLDVASGIYAPNGTETVTKFMETSVASAHQLAKSTSGFIGYPVHAEFFWKPGERNQLRLNIFEQGSTGRVLLNIEIGVDSYVSYAGYFSTVEASSGGFYHVVGISSLTSAVDGVDYVFYMMNGSGSVNYAGTSGSGLYLWHPSLSKGPLAPYTTNSADATSGDCVILDTEWDSTSGAEKFFDESKTPGGARTRYVYGQRDRFKLNAEFLTTRDMQVLNKWWRDGTPILMRDADDPFAAINSVFIADSSPPVAKQIKPYADAWAISIELEGY